MKIDNVHSRRFKALKEIVFSDDYNGSGKFPSDNFNKEDLMWFFEQAERTECLEVQNENYRHGLEFAIKHLEHFPQVREIRQVEMVIQALRDAL